MPANRLSRRSFVLCCIGVAFTCGIIIAADKASNLMLDDVWSGTLNAGAFKLRLVFKFKKGPDGTFTGTMDSLDQSAFGLKIDKVVQNENSVNFELSAIGGSYQGKFSKDGNTIVGVWKQGLNKLPLELKRGMELKATVHPQEPKPPFPYDVTEVTYENVAGKAKFAGTLTQPRTPKPHPAVLLITGSGTQNRDEELFGHKPFLLLADSLTRRGIAVLRVDDRGIGGSTGEVANATTDDFVADALSGIQFLRSRKEIDGHRIGLLGHSEGANIAVEVAAKPDRVSFIVLLAPTAVPGDQLLFKQAELISRASGIGAEAISLNRQLQEDLFALAKSSRDPATRDADVDTFIAEWKAKQTAKPLISDAELKSQARQILLPWYRRFIEHDPRQELGQVRCPVLALFGERDLQVPPSQNRPPLESAFKASGHSDYAIHEFPSLNHLFQTSKTGLPAEYSSIEETMNPNVLTVIGDWVTKHSVKSSDVEQ